jgi:hypothetical protein
MHGDDVYRDPNGQLWHGRFYNGTGPGLAPDVSLDVAIASSDYPPTMKQTMLANVFWNIPATVLQAVRFLLQFGVAARVMLTDAAPSRTRPPTGAVSMPLAALLLPEIRRAAWSLVLLFLGCRILTLVYKHFRKRSKAESQGRQRQRDTAQLESGLKVIQELIRANTPPDQLLPILQALLSTSGCK